MLNKLRTWVSRAQTLQQASNAPDVPGIASFDVIPGRLAATVYEQEFEALGGRVHCWMYVSQGFVRVAGKEVVLSVERGAEHLEDCTSAVRDLFEWLHAQALQARVGMGSIVSISADGPGLLGDPRLRGIAFIPTGSSGGPLPPASFTAVLLTQNELETAKRYGVVRLLGLLGHRYRRFPTAAWVVRGRPDITSPEAMASSILSKAASLRLSNCRAYLRGIETARESRPPTGSLENNLVRFARQEVVVEVAAREAEGASRLISERWQYQAVALFLCPDPDADASLVWVPDSSSSTAAQTNVISSEEGTGTRIAGNHVLFVPEQSRDEVRIVEDGFAVLLTNETWLDISRRLASPPQNWGMPFSDGIGFRLKVGTPDL